MKKTKNKIKYYFLIALFVGILTEPNISGAAETITFDFGVQNGTVFPFQLYMNGIQDTRGPLDNARIKDLGYPTCATTGVGCTVHRTYWNVRDWAPTGVDQYDWNSQGAPYGSMPRMNNIALDMDGDLLVAQGGNFSMILPYWIRSTDPVDTEPVCDYWKGTDSSIPANDVIACDPSVGGGYPCDGNKDSDKHFPNNLTNYRHILVDGFTELKRRYGSKFKYYSLYNEPGGGTPCNTAARFKLMAEQAVSAANEVNASLPESQHPHIKIVGPGMSAFNVAFDDLNYMGEVLDHLNSKGMKLDGMAYHWYNTNGKPFYYEGRNEYIWDGSEDGELRKRWMPLYTSKGYPSTVPVFVTETNMGGQNAHNMSFTNPPCSKAGYIKPEAPTLAQYAAWRIADYLAFQEIRDTGIDIIPFHFGGPLDYAANQRSILVYPCAGAWNYPLHGDGLVNPVYNAMLMWKQMTSGTKVASIISDKNKVGGVAVYGSNEIKIILYNNTGNYLWNETAPTITLNNLPAGWNNVSYTWKKWTVDQWNHNFASAYPQNHLISMATPDETGTATLSSGITIADNAGTGLSSRMNNNSVVLYVFTNPTTNDAIAPAAPSGLLVQ